LEKSGADPGSIEPREEAMHVSRRNLAIAGAVALGAASLVRGSAGFADASDEAAVKQSVEALRKALLAADKAQLEQLAADQLSYGHSDGKVQTKAEFVDGVVTRKATVKSLTFPELTVAVAGDAAIARHLYVSEAETDGKPSNVWIGVLAVWQKEDGNWKLLARQGYKLA
jgi:ketosteroid isomerase-like protein